MHYPKLLTMPKAKNEKLRDQPKKAAVWPLEIEAVFPVEAELEPAVIGPSGATVKGLVARATALVKQHVHASAKVYSNASVQGGELRLKVRGTRRAQDGAAGRAALLEGLRGLLRQGVERARQHKADRFERESQHKAERFLERFNAAGGDGEERWRGGGGEEHEGAAVAALVWRERRDYRALEEDYQELERAQDRLRRDCRSLEDELVEPRLALRRYEAEAAAAAARGEEGVSSAARRAAARGAAAGGAAAGGHGHCGHGYGGGSSGGSGGYGYGRSRSRSPDR